VPALEEKVSTSKRTMNCTAIEWYPHKEYQ